MITVEQIPASEAAPWILTRHYARRMCPISFAFGAFCDGVLIGVVTYGKPCSPHLCRGLCGEDWSDNVTELNRLCCDNEQNIASAIVGRSLRMIPRPSIVVSYADTGKGHVGYVYQATNFLYTGITDDGRKTPRTDRIVVDGRHGRHEARVNGCDKVDVSKGVLVYRKPKHRYVYFCGDRRQVKAMRAALKYPIEPYPKGESRRYDASAVVQTQGVLF
jgi:hypothetical protein